MGNSYEEAERVGRGPVGSRGQGPFTPRGAGIRSTSGRASGGPDIARSSSISEVSGGARLGMRRRRLVASDPLHDEPRVVVVRDV